MNIFQALILGIVEGLTEFLPVSSTGHLLLTQRLLGLSQDDVSNAFVIFIQGGAIAAVIGLYQKRLLSMTKAPHLLVCLIVAFLPAAVVGFLFDKRIEHYLFGLWPVVAAWFVGGLALLIFAGRWQKKAEDNRGFALENLDYKTAFVIGCAQCLAMWPGTSRSLVTIVAALILGLSMSAALEFSFLLGLITLGAATSYKALKFGPAMFTAYGPATLITGFLTAWVFAAASIKWMVGYLQKHSLRIFGYWRVGLAAATAAFLLLVR